MAEQVDAEGFRVLTLEQHFANWESETFGFGYGTGEPHVMDALGKFMRAIKPAPERGYDYQVLEAACGSAVAWLLINALCRWKVEVLEYGTSPRYGWLTREGERLREFVVARSTEQLLEALEADADDQTHCSFDSCNCGPRGYSEGRKCPNPFWSRRR